LHVAAAADRPPRSRRAVLRRGRSIWRRVRMQGESPADVAAALRISERTVYRWLARIDRAKGKKGGPDE
jgi:transposase